MNRLILTCALFLMLIAAAPRAASAEIVQTLATKSGVSETEARDRLNAVVDAIKTELHAGSDVTIKNFGRFYVQDRAAREGRNPRTGEKLAIPAKKYPKFTSSDNFKKEMNN